MSKLIIQIPCLNEEETLPISINALPKSIPGVDVIETMIINDGSTDKTAEIARKLGVNHIVNLPTNKGLANAFNVGLAKALELGADFLVNTDADNQYNADDIQLLLEPLIAQKADMVVGERPIQEIESFSTVKKNLQVLGSKFIRLLSKCDVKDTPSGFRGLNRKAMASINVFNPYTYTHESLIAAHENNLTVIGIPIRVNKTVLRESRLMKSMFGYIVKSGLTMLRFYIIYNPYKILLTLSGLTTLTGVGLLIRFLVFYLNGNGDGWIQSLIIGCTLIIIGVLSLLIAIVSDIQSINRKLLQKILFEIKNEKKNG